MVIFALIVLVVWILLPFAIFGMKPKLDRIIYLLEQQLKESKKEAERGQNPPSVQESKEGRRNERANSHDRFDIMRD